MEQKERKERKGIMVGQIIDGMWRIESREKADGETRSYIYKLVNIYNHREIKIRGNALRRIKRGETSVAKITAYRLTVGTTDVKSNNPFGHSTKAIRGRYRYAQARKGQ